MRVDRFFESLPFRPDPFQTMAAEAVERGSSVVVTAPTGAGKTLVAEAAVHLSLERGRRVFYTTPLKALSNQKFRDFAAVYGAERVGLLTGDNTINGGAPIVVMTTEVLRNMIYAGGDLSSVDTAVLDEVHYLQDRFRGAVWEEVIIHAPRHIRLVCLSATVANADEFTDWLRARRGRAELVIEDHRPVPLERWWAAKDRFEGKIHTLPLFEEAAGGSRPNRSISGMLARRGGRRRRFATPRRLEMVERLAALDMLPAIYFVFSRAGCDESAARTAVTGVRLTNREEQEEIRRRAEQGAARLEAADLRALGYDQWLAALEKGVAAHHAGMVPAFKEVVEQLFCDGLVKLVFATETLSLGINMPARTVVLDSLTKFTGEGHELMLPGEFTQLTGRAGRRGIDEVGHGVVLHSPYVPFERAASIAHLGSHPLRSKFRPTYNMAVNLVANYPRRQAERLLEASFAQFRLRGARVVRSSPGLERPGGSGGLVGFFHRTRSLLEERGYLDGWNLLPPGQALRRVYNEMDFLLVEAVQAGVFEDVSPPELAALASTFVYEPRRDAEPGGDWPSETLEQRWGLLVNLWERHTAAEQAHGLAATRPPQPGFGPLAYAWAQLRDLEELLEDTSLDPGDFVRTSRQIMDVLRQLRDAAGALGVGGLDRTASQALAAVDRGVVTAGGAV